MLLLYILFAVYIFAVNFYAILLVKSQRDESTDANEKPSGDGKLILTAILGGALAIYICMFIMRYRLKNLMLMLLMPVIAVLNIYIAVAAFRSGFTFFIF